MWTGRRPRHVAMKTRNLMKQLPLLFSALVIAGCSVGLLPETSLIEFSVDATSVQHNHKAPAVTATDSSGSSDVLLKYVDCSGNLLGEGTGSVDLMVEWTGTRNVSAQCYSGGEKLGTSNVVAVSGLDSPPCQVTSDGTGGSSLDKSTGNWEADIDYTQGWETSLTFTDVNGDIGEVVFIRAVNNKNQETSELPMNATLISLTPQVGEAGRALFTLPPQTEIQTFTYHLYFTGYIPHHDSYSGQEMCLTINHTVDG